jgi:hypothetical protein
MKVRITSIDVPMTDDREDFDSLLAIQTLESYSDDEALEIIGNLIDSSLDFQRDDGIDTALSLADELLQRDLTEEKKALLHYFLANAWSNRRILQRTTLDEEWEWEQEEIENEIVHLRLALKYGISHESRKPVALSPQGQLPVWTNYGNLMSHVGRVVEGIECRDKALEINPSFAMALGTKGQSLLYYSQHLYDNGHRGVIIKQAHQLLKKALEGNLHITARKAFETDLKRIEDICSQEYLSSTIDLDSFSLGDSEQEINYRRWCLNNRLFLNPLNDLGPYAIGARDILSAPSIVTGIDEGPYYYGFFNQMKQEFVSARYLYYEGINDRDPHFSDKDVLLYDTLDSPSYGLAVEKVKMAYRTIYSLFDKIAFFLNKYIDLKIHEKDVSFRSLWYVEKKRKYVLRDNFCYMENFPLRGLFWLSKDFYEQKDDFKNSIEPDAKDLSEIRNHLEHKYLKLHQEYWRRADENNPFLKGLVDTLAYSLSRSEFEEKTMKLLKLARSALIYLTLSIQCEEQKRREERKQYSRGNSRKYIMKMQLDLVDDNWKC